MSLSQVWRNIVSDKMTGKRELMIMLQAFEFRANIKNGTIVLPDEYKPLIKEFVKVIIIQEAATQAKNQPDILQQLLDHPIPDPDFKPFKRSEIYARDI